MRTVKVYGTTVPTVAKLVAVVALTTESDGDCVTGIVNDVVFDVTVADGVPDVADAVFARLPASTSACVVV